MPLRRNLLDLQNPADPQAALPVDAQGGDALGGGVPPGGTDTLTTDDLSQLAGAGTDTVNPDQMQEEQLMQQLQDPNTPPDVKAQLQARLALAARRRLAGVGDTTTPLQ